MLRTLLLALTMALLVTRVDAAPPARPARTVTVWLQAELEIGTDGRVATLQWKDTRESLRMVTVRLEPHVRQWTFEPGQIDGVPQRTRTYLTIQVIGEATSANAIALRLGHVAIGARADRMMPPRYPVGALRDGDVAGVVAIVKIEPDGTSRIESLDYRGNRARHRAEFLKAVEEAIGRSRFVHERVGDRVLAAHVRIPFEFCAGARCPQPLPAEAGDSAAQGPAGEAVALDSAVKLLDDVSGLTI